MRVMLVGYFLGQGGIQNHLRWLTRMLGEEGIETLAFSTNFGAVSSDDWQYLQQFQSGSVQFICQPVQQNQSQSARGASHLCKSTNLVICQSLV